MFSSSYRYQINRWYFRPSDVFIASYPRSGNTWMRLLLSDVIRQLGGHETEAGGNVIPDVYKVDIEDWYRNPQIDIPFRAIKTHEPYDLISDYRIIYLFRNPKDCLCSYYYYSLRSPKFRDNNSGIDAFCLGRMEQWNAHIKSYIAGKETAGDRIFLVSYESMKRNPQNVLKRVCQFLSLEVTDRQCRRAVEHQEFHRLKQLADREDSRRLGFAEQGGFQNFFRRGRVNGGDEELSAETVETLDTHCRPLYDQIKQWEADFSRPV